jgi:site-specific DNA recombinase
MSDDSRKKNIAVEGNVRCAIYARYSSELQRASSIEDQIRKCREYAQKKGWVIDETYVRYDQATSGTSLVGRDGINSLVMIAKQHPRPFDVLLIDDTSRLARNLAQAQTILKTLRFWDIRVISVSQGLDSGEKSAQQLFAIYGLMDEQFSQALAEKVHRGQAGRVLKGQIAGGAVYGYRGAPDEDFTRKGDYGRPFVNGVGLEVVPEEAEVIRRIFEMYSGGLSYDKIARKLRAEGVPAPRPPRKDSIRAWSADGVAHILRNQKYIGIHIWSRTKSVRDEIGRIAARPRPQEEWVKCDVPDWRIVADDLWKRAHEIRERKKVRFQVHGGLNRTKRSELYLFSGLLICGLCRRSITIVESTGDYARYGCGLHRNKGGCTNAVTIRREHLEEQLLSWLTRDLLEPNRLEEALTSFHARLQKQELELRAQAQKNSINMPELLKELAEKKSEAWNITDFILADGRNVSPTVRARLAATEARIKEIEEQLSRASQCDESVCFSLDEARAYVKNKLYDLRAVLTSAPLVAKQVCRKHISKIILTPKQADKAWALDVTVEFELGKGGDSGVMLTARVESYLQHYGFMTITLDGLELKRWSPSPRKVKSKSSQAEISEEPSSTHKGDPNPTFETGHAESETSPVLSELASSLITDATATSAPPVRPDGEFAPA